MADEELAIAGSALETPASETEQQQVETPETEVETDEVDTEQEGEGPDDGGEEEVDELEFQFKKYQVPKSLKEAVEGLRADYTRKTQETAAKAKAFAALETREAEIEERAKATEEELEARAELKSVTKTLEQFAKLTPEDWAAHEANDFAATQAAWRQYQMLKDQKAELDGKLTKAQAERTEKAQSDLTKRIQETLEHAQKNTSGLKPDAIPKLVEFAEQLGVPEEAIKRNWSPIFADLLHYARIGKMAAAKQNAAPKPAGASTSAPTPITPVAPKGAPPKTGLSDNLPLDEWQRRREAQLRKKA